MVSESPRPELPTALEFMESLWRLNHALERLSSRMDRTFGITAQQRFLLRHLGQSPGVRPGELAERLHLDPGTISAGLRRLEHKELIVRSKDTRDARKTQIRLTTKGRRLHRPQKGTVEHAAEKLLAGVPAGDIQATLRTLARLAQALDEELSDSKR